MKKLFIVLFISLMFVSSVPTTHAVTVTPEPSSAPTDEESLKQIEKIKDLVASRVAELKLVDKRGILGTVTSTTNSQIALTDVNGNKKIVDIDEITKFSDEDNKEYGISDVKKGDMLGIMGLYNKDTERLLARFVDTIATVPTHFEGVITSIDKVNFQLHAVDENGNERILDVVPTTKSFNYTKDQGQLKSGFSKFAEGERVFASGFMDSKVKNQINSSRIISFPQLPPSEKMKSNVPAGKTVSTPTPTSK